MTPLSAPLPAAAAHRTPRRWDDLQDAHSERFKTAGWTPWPGMRDVFRTQRFAHSIGAARPPPRG
eukprot:5407913-Prymnesium_polylepis.1